MMPRSLLLTGLCHASSLHPQRDSLRKNSARVLAGGWFIKDQKASGLMFDRLRLCLLEQSRGPDSLDPFREEMADLTKKALNL